MGNIAEKAAQRLQHNRQSSDEVDAATDLFDLVCQYSRLRSQPRAPEIEMQLRTHDQALVAAQRVLLSNSRDPQSRKMQQYLSHQLKTGVELLRNENEIRMSVPSPQMQEDDGFIVIDIAREAEKLVPVTHPALAEVCTRYGAVRVTMAESIASLGSILPEPQCRALQQLLDAFDRAWRAAAQICSEEIYTQERSRNSQEISAVSPPAAAAPDTESAEPAPADEIEVAPAKPVVASKQEVAQRHHNALRLQHWLELAVAIAQKWEEVVPWLLDDPERAIQLTQVQTVEQFEEFCEHVQRTIKITRADQDALFDSNCCPICFEPYNRQERQLVTPMPAACGHVFCYCCGVDILHKFHECPFCRKPFTAMVTPTSQQA